MLHQHFCLLGRTGGAEHALQYPETNTAGKISGVYMPHALLTRGFDGQFSAPHSRYAAFPEAMIRENTDLDILAASEEAGAYLFASKDKRQVYVTGHAEYDADTLAGEYQRDSDAGLDPAIP